MRSARKDSSAASHTLRSSIEGPDSGLAIPVVQALATTIDDLERCFPLEAAFGQVLARVRILADLRCLHRADRQELERCVRRIDDLVRILGSRGNERDVTRLER